MLIDYFKYLYYRITKKKINYEMYLLTKHWKKIRLKALKRNKYKCQLCGTRKYTLDVHHNSYEHLYWEHRSDLIVLCRKCHYGAHTLFYWIKKGA